MGKLLARKKRVKRIVRIGTVSPAAVGQVEDLDARIEAIQLLIPLGLQAVNEELHRAVIELAEADSCTRACALFQLKMGLDRYFSRSILRVSTLSLCSS